MSDWTKREDLPRHRVRKGPDKILAIVALGQIAATIVGPLAIERNAHTSPAPELLRAAATVNAGYPRPQLAGPKGDDEL